MSVGEQEEREEEGGSVGGGWRERKDRICFKIQQHFVP